MKRRDATGRNEFLQLQTELAQQGNRFYRFAFRLCGSHEDAEDLVASAFLNAYRHQHKIQDTEALVTWLYRIVLNEWKMNRRRKQIDSVPLSDIHDKGTEMESSTLALLQALNNLSSKQREAVVLVKAEGLTLREAASLLRRPAGTVASHVAQGMKLLKEELFPSGKVDQYEVKNTRLNHEV